MTEQTNTMAVQIIGQNKDVVDAYGTMLAIKHRSDTLTELKGLFSEQDGEYYAKDDIVTALTTSIDECSEALSKVGSFDVQIAEQLDTQAI